MFDLETAIATWRHSLSYRRTILKEDLDELERHVRDEVDYGLSKGFSEEKAFRLAMAHMGSNPSIDKEYQKIFWGKLRKRRALKEELSWRFSMLKNYFKIAFRLLVKQKTYAFINIFGLAIGIAFCVLLLLYVRDELTFDSQHENGDRIARVVQEQRENDGSIKSAQPWMPYPLGKALENDISGVEAAIRLFDRSVIVRSGDKILEENALFADPSFLSAFTYPLIEGTTETAFPNENGLVISRKTAVKYFGDQPAVGKSLEFRFNQVYEEVVITGVVEDIPGNNSVQFDILLPFDLLPQKYDWIQTDQWNASSFYVYVLLDKGADLARVESLLPEFRRKYFPDDELTAHRKDGSWTNALDPVTYHFQPLREIHLDPSVKSGLASPSNPMYSWILAGIALTILILACINFTTLSIGRSASRTREIALRKVVGAQRMQLIGQFGGEAALMSFVALGLGFLLSAVLLPTFNQLANKELTFGGSGAWMIPVGLIGLGILVALLSGFYPSMVLSRFQPTDMLRKQSRLGGSHRLTTGLVLFQFTLSIALIAGTSIMSRQMRYLQTVDIGYDKDHVVLVSANGTDSEQFLSRMRTELQDQPDIEGVTAMTNAFSHGWSSNGWTYKDRQVSAYVYRIETNFLGVMGIPLTEGRNFDPQRSLDSTRSVIVNEAMVRTLELADPVGQPLYGFGGGENGDATIVGVVKDFNFLSLHEEVLPMVFILDPRYSIGEVLIQIRPENIQATIQKIQNVWDQHAPEIPFQYSFLDDDLNKQYQSEARWSKIIFYSAIFAVLIACLGLFGLASLSVASRTKEIGIRRVMGANTASIAALLSKGFIRIVIVAVAFAIPITWIAASKWLDNFAFRIDIGFWVFVISALLAISVALLTVSFQTIRAAGANPIESLKVD